MSWRRTLRTSAAVLASLILAPSIFGLAGEATGAGTTRLRVSVEVAGSESSPDGFPVAAVVRLERLGAVRASADGKEKGEEDRETREAAVPVPGGTVMTVPAHGVWRLTLDAPGLWAPPVSWQSPADGRVTIRAVRTGDLRGRLVFPAGDSPSEETAKKMTARFQRATDEVEDPPPERHTVDCPLESNSTFTCSLPAGRSDVRLRVPGFVSVYLWNVEVPAGGETAVGELTLVRGASLVAWIEAEGAPPDFDVTRVGAELVPETAGLEAMAEDRQRRQLLELDGHPNERGFLEFAGVSPGTYRLRLEYPGLATTELAPLVVVAGSETELEKAVLRPPLRLSVALDPPQDGRRRPWFLVLSRYSDVPGHLDSTATGSAGPEGRWVHKGLDPGRYKLVVADGSGSRWATHEIDLTTDQDLRLDLPFERVEGRVSFGGEPLAAAKVWFGGRSGSTRISALSDEDGAVYVFLPIRQTWSIEVTATTPAVQARLDGLEVRDHPTQPWRLVDIDLPRTGLGGEVTREGGEPAAGALVRLMREGLPIRLIAEMTDDDGRFQVRALAEGEWRAQAEWHDERGRGWQSDSLLVEVDEDGFEEVDLVLRRPWTFSGQVVGPDGTPVFAAEVLGTPVFPGPRQRTSRVATAVTGLSGEFEIELPAEATAVQLTVLPPGYSARKWPALERGSSPRVLTVDRQGGTLRIVGLGDPSTTPLENQPGIFTTDRWSLSTLLRWARMAGGETAFGGRDLVVPAMPPDRYQICPNGTKLAAVAAGEAACVGGDLLPYSELTLAAPPSRP